MQESLISSTCYHCGEDCSEHDIILENKHFCCTGCKLVYELLQENSLCTYYSLENNPGNTLNNSKILTQFDFLNDSDVRKNVISFSDGKESHAIFYIPSMHCNSCIYLLEKLHRLNDGVIRSEVNFLKKELKVIYHEEKISLPSIATLITKLGYEPYFSLAQTKEQKSKPHDRSRIYKIGIAGFCFGNIMMLSFPEYFSLNNFSDHHTFSKLFGYLSIALSFPVVFYAASDFFISGFKALRGKFLNIDLPIALAIFITYTRSLYEIISGTGAGYLDSMSGIVFLMVLGRYFQDKTYETLSFERDYRSFFPISITRIKNSIRENIPVSKLNKEDRIIVRNNELIPADAILLEGNALIDYSFVTGESDPVEKYIGDLIYAGGRQCGSSLTLEIVKEVSQSHLTQLWNNDAFDDRENRHQSFIHQVSKYFTFILLLITTGAFVYWINIDTQKAWNVVTTTLIVACPCTLLLSATFTFGNVMRIYAKNKFYVKNSDVVERIKDIDVIVFDKTGTLTIPEKSNVIYTGKDLSEKELQWISTCLAQSTHPLSKRLHQSLISKKSLTAYNFTEYPGKGIVATVMDHSVRIGSYEFVFMDDINSHPNDTRVYVEIDGMVKGYYTFSNVYREGLQPLMNALLKNHQLMLLSGDNDSERKSIEVVMGKNAELYFSQTPQQKLDKISSLQDSGKKVMMIGDGLNDAGALKQSDVGIAVSDNTNNFFPACDVIMGAESFQKISSMISFAKSTNKIIYSSFALSLVYNVIGLSFALQGILSPLVAAILMPASSISIILFTFISGSISGRKLFGK